MLKVATKEDLTTVVDFAKKFHSNNIYKDIEFNRDKVTLFINHLIDDPKSLVLLLEENNTTVGALLATTEEIVFSIDTMALEVMLWVEEDYRGKNSWELVEAYQYWANRLGCTICFLSTLEGPLVDILDSKYKKLGFLPAERTYMKVLT